MPYSNTSPMTPQEIVQELDKHIIGQHDAKRAVANALRNRWRRTQLPAELRAEIKPKNILMIGPTGVGKTEIARRLAKINNAPFLKIEATKFTEVGYVGRDVDSIIRDLVDAAIKDAREQAIIKMRHKAEEAAEERILDVLIPKHSHDEFERDESKLKEESAARQAFRKLLREKQLEDKEIEIDISSTIGVEIMAPPGMEEMTQQLQNMLQNMASEKKRKRKMKIKDAYKLLTDEEASKLIDEDEIKRQALYNVEQNGIVFIDEIDKITRRAEYSGSSDISREGVQRDLLPLIEGSTISTKYGMIKTDHILFIASGAFQLTKPSDLIPELQGRLPIRVELLPLSVEDFVSILIEPNASLTEQYIALLSTEEVTITFTESGIRRLAEIAWHVNERTENIGARRLHTVMEKLLENISYTANEQSGHKVDIDAAYVNGQLEKLVQNEDLSQYIL